MNTEPDSWLRSELRAKLTELADLRLRLAATERHCTDLQQVNEQLRHDGADREGELHVLRAELREAEARRGEAGAVMDLLKPADRPVWQQ